jgi:hypothetical protein
MRALRAAWLAALVPALCAQTTSVHDLIATMRRQIESADYRISGQLVSVQANGTRQSFPVTIEAHWFPGVLRTIVEIANAPKTGPGSLVRSRIVTHALLEMRPDGQSSIWIAHPGDKSPLDLPFEKWNNGPLGSGFSYEDFLDQQYFWPGQTSEGKQMFGARDCEVVKSAPGLADRTHYASVKTWIDPAIDFPVYVEKTVKDTGEVKEFTSYGIRHEEGVWSAHQIEVKARGKAGSTLLVFNRGSAKAHLTLNDFNPSQLVRF